MTAPLDQAVLDAAVRRWRKVCIANTIAGVVVTATAAALFSAGMAVAIGLFMLLAVADTWYLARRVPETGNPFIRPRRSSPNP